MSACAIGFALTFPLFIHVGPGGIGLGQRVFREFRTPGVDLPISAFTIPLILGVVLVFRKGWRLPWHVADRFVAVFCAVNVLAFLGGILFAGRVPLVRVGLSGAFLLQTLLPLAGFYLARIVWVGSAAGASQEHSRWCTEVVAWTMRFAFLALMLLVVQSAVERGIGNALSERLVDYFGPVNVTKIKRYYPTILAAVGTFYVARAMVKRSTTRVRFVDLAIGLTIASLLPFIWSRSAIVTLAVAWLGLVACAIGWRRRRITVPVLGGSVVLLAFASLALGFFASSNAIAATRFREMLVQGSRISVGDARRVAAAKEMLTGRGMAPLGKMYQPRMQLTLAGQPYEFPRIGMPENAYLDYADKAGPLALMSFVGLIVYLLWRGFRLVYQYWDGDSAERPDDVWVLYGTWSVMVALVIWSNFTQLNFSEPYAAFYFWFLLGTLVTWDQKSVRLPT